MNRHLLSLPIALAGLLLAAPVAAQDEDAADEVGPVDPGQETEVNEDNYRRFMENIAPHVG